METAGRTTLAANIVSGNALQVWSALSRELLLVRLPGSHDNGGSRCCLVPPVGLHILRVSKTQGNVIYIFFIYMGPCIVNRIQ